MSRLSNIQIFYNRIILVLLYRNDVKVYSGLVQLYMHFDIHSYEFAVSGLAQEPDDLVSALHFKVSPMIPLDPIKTMYSVA